MITGRSAAMSRRALLVGGSALLVSASGKAPRPSFTIQSHVASANGMLASSHLLLGREDAVLIDATFLKVDAGRIADMVDRSERRLSRVVVTHAHPDHFMGAGTLKARFPAARFLARPSVAAEIASSYQMATTMMGRDFGDALDTAPVAFEPFTEEAIRLEDQVLPMVEFSGGESHDALAVLTPGGGEVLTGDILYDGAHLYLADRDVAGWRSHLDQLEVLRTRRARPGHGRPGPTLALIATTRRYLDAFEREAARASSAEALTARMIGLYPGWAAQRLLRFSSAARFPKS